MEKTIGEKLKEARKGNGLTLQTVAGKIGCSPSYIHRIENNQRVGINYKIKEKLFELYGIEKSSEDEDKLLSYLAEMKILIGKIENII